MLTDEALIERLQTQLDSIATLKKTGTICPWIFIVLMVHGSRACVVHGKPLQKQLDILTN